MSIDNWLMNKTRTLNKETKALVVWEEEYSEEQCSGNSGNGGSHVVTKFILCCPKFRNEESAFECYLDHMY